MGARKPRAIGYLRVSTVEQVGGFGLEVQHRAVREYAKAHGLRIVGVHRDEGESGSNGLDSRPELAEALSRLESGEAEVLLVWKLDRLARDLVLQETVIERLNGRGIEVVSVTEPELNGEDETRVLVRQVLGAIGQYERAVIRKRMAAGRVAKGKAGGYAGGRPPYGYRAEDGELVPDEAEQAALKLARRLRRRGRSLRDIGEALEAAGHSPRRARSWHPNQVSRLLG